MRIDSHQHFWLFDPVKDAWITDDMKVIRRNFLPNDISKILKDNRIDGAVLVQADQSLRETDFLIELAGAYKMVKAVVGWVDLRSEDVEEHLLKFSVHPIVKGFRHIIEAEADADFLMQPAFQRGIKALTERGYTYDLLIHPRHYTSTLECVAAHPKQAFMLDHMAKPAVAAGEFEEWATFIEALAAFPNVYCKISGLIVDDRLYEGRGISDITIERGIILGVVPGVAGRDGTVLEIVVGCVEYHRILVDLADAGKL